MENPTFLYFRHIPEKVMYFGFLYFDDLAISTLTVTLLDVKCLAMASFRCYPPSNVVHVGVNLKEARGSWFVKRLHTTVFPLIYSLLTPPPPWLV